MYYVNNKLNGPLNRHAPSFFYVCQFSSLVKIIDVVDSLFYSFSFPLTVYCMVIFMMSTFLCLLACSGNLFFTNNGKDA